MTESLAIAHSIVHETLSHTLYKIQIADTLLSSYYENNKLPLLYSLSNYMEIKVLCYLMSIPFKLGDKFIMIRKSRLAASQQ